MEMDWVDAWQQLVYEQSPFKAIDDQDPGLVEAGSSEAYDEPEPVLPHQHGTDASTPPPSPASSTSGSAASPKDSSSSTD
jgi:hypothetical protein